MRKPIPEGYSGSQILLHWLIAAMVLFQLWFGEDMARAQHVLRRGGIMTPEQGTQVSLHVWVGWAILAAVIVRLALRVAYGAPPAPTDEPRMAQILGRLSHHAFYLLLILVPLTGIVAYYRVPAVGEIHTLGKPAFIVLIGLHVLAVLWHQFYRHDGVLMRMVRPNRRPARDATIGGAPGAA